MLARPSPSLYVKMTDGLQCPPPFPPPRVPHRTCFRVKVLGGKYFGRGEDREYQILITETQDYLGGVSTHAIACMKASDTQENKKTKKVLSRQLSEQIVAGECLLLLTSLWWQQQESSHSLLLIAPAPTLRFARSTGCASCARKWVRVPHHVADLLPRRPSRPLKNTDFPRSLTFHYGCSRQIGGKSANAPSDKRVTLPSAPLLGFDVQYMTDLASLKLSEGGW